MTTGVESRPPGAGMELTEAVHRIFVRHWLLIAIAVALGLGAGALRTVGGTSFTATTRLVLDAPDPRTSAESMAIADTVRAIATSPSQVRSALAGKAAAGRDPIDVAEHHVSVSALGTSGVVELSVSDRNAAVAPAIANALAGAIIQTRLNISTGRAQQLVADLNRQINALQRRIARADATSRPLLLQQSSALQVDRANVLTTEAAEPKPSIISQARKPSSPDAAPVAPLLILGAILGFVMGVGAAGILEVVRPSVVGGVALAREFGTRYIGTTGSDDLPWRAGMVASTEGLATVGLISVGKGITIPDVEAIAGTFEGARANSETGVSGRGWRVASDEGRVPAAAAPVKATRARGPRAAGPRFLPFFEMVPGEAKGEIGLLLVAPKTLLKSDVIEANNLLSLVPHSVLGLITHEPHRGRGRRSAQGAPAVAPQNSVRQDAVLDQ
jgi:hypothetical protein